MFGKMIIISQEPGTMNTATNKRIIPIGLIFALLLTIIVIDYKTDAAGSILSENWKFHFRGGSTMGIFLAVATPLQNGKNTYLAYNFEANYVLPNNALNYEYPPLIARQGKGINRQFVYDAIESKMKMYGFPGKNCMMRTICEASEESVKDNGVMGDILHIIFTPSTSNDNITSEYERAELKGRQGNCQDYNKNCTISFLSAISWIGEAL